MPCFKGFSKLPGVKKEVFRFFFFPDDWNFFFNIRGGVERELKGKKYRHLAALRVNNQSLRWGSTEIFRRARLKRKHYPTWESRVVVRDKWKAKNWEYSTQRIRQDFSRSASSSLYEPSTLTSIQRCLDRHLTKDHHNHAAS